MEVQREMRTSDISRVEIKVEPGQLNDHIECAPAIEELWLKQEPIEMEETSSPQHTDAPEHDVSETTLPLHPDEIKDEPLRPFELTDIIMGETNTTSAVNMETSEIDSDLNEEVWLKDEKVTNERPALSPAEHMEDKELVSSATSTSGNMVKQSTASSINTSKGSKMSGCRIVLDGKLDCPQCEFTTWHILDLQNHVNNTHGLILTREQILQASHAVSHKNEPSLSCTHCKKRSSSKHFLELHMTRKHLQHQTGHSVMTRPANSEDILGCLKCAYCKFSSHDPAKIRLHLHRRHPAKKFSCQCELCPYVTDQKYCMLSHVNYHHRAVQCTCQLCGESFTKDNAVFRHLVNHINQQDDKILCESCNYGSKHIRDIMHHMRTKHVEDKLFRCGECDMTFIELFSLEAHYARTHNLTRDAPTVQRKGEISVSQALRLNCPYQDCTFDCDCGNQKALDKHLYKHNGTDFFTCEYCPCTFPKLQLLLEHSKQHNSHETWLCRECGEVFSARQYLLFHHHVTAGEKHHQPRNKCPICNKAVFYRSLLAFHIESHKRAQSSKTVPITTTEQTVTRNGTYQCTTKPIALGMETAPISKPQHTSATTMPRAPQRFATLIPKGDPKAIRTTSKTYQYRCSFPQCHHVTNVKHMYDQHFKKHNGTDYFGCVQCPDTFTKLDDLLDHSEAHVGKKKSKKIVKCATCLTAFYERKYLAFHSHVTGHFTPGINLHNTRCPVCRKKFFHKLLQLSHMPEHLVKEEPISATPD